MKILQTPIRFYPYIGGIENHAYHLSKNLVKLGHEVNVICANEPKLKREETIEGIKIKRLWYLFKIQNTNITPFLPLNLLSHDADVIHTYFPSPWCSDWSNIVGKLKKIPTVFHYYNDLTEKQFIRQIYNKTMLSASFKLAKKILVAHERYIDYSFILPKYREKIAVIPPGVDTALFRPSKKQINAAIFGFASVLDSYHEYKGLNYLFKSIRKSKLKIVGGGDMLDYYKIKAARKDVEFLGALQPIDMKEFYHKIGVFVLPTIGYKEGFGIVALEAMASGIPVIVSSIVGVADDIEKNNCGIVIKPKNVKELGNAIKYFEDNKSEIKIMGRRARKAVENYSWEKIAKRTEELYKEIKDN
jgi:glycosyltransferase involved in cell wall biosynthesis